MPASISKLQAYLVADAQDHPLPSPQPIDLATDVVPYGARVRLEATVEATGPVHPLMAMVSGPGVLSGEYMFPTDGELTFVQQVRVPTDFVYGERAGVSPPLRFPLSEWQPGGYVPPPGGDCLVRICPIPVGTRPTWPVGEQPPLDGPLATFEARLRVGAPPSSGGGAPRIVAVEGGPAAGQVRIGEPWLLTARVQDAEDDVAGVLFSVVRGGVATWHRCNARGSGGAGEVQYSLQRVGGDKWDRWGIWGDTEDQIVLSLQAVDLRGNWSEPATIEYTLRRDVAPVWVDEPAADGPNIIAAGVSRDQGLFDLPRVWAKCDAANVWGCARLITQPDQVWPLWDDAQGGGNYLSVVPLDRGRYWDVVFYAVPKTGPARIGKKLAATCPPVI